MHWLAGTGKRTQDGPDVAHHVFVLIHHLTSDPR
jgi:hypothetical protein